MKISIYNFKSIRELKDLELKPLTIIAGVNNSGKSSLLQFLLLMKQTIERASTAEPLVAQGDSIRISNLKDLVFKRLIENKISISFDIAAKELPDIEQYQDFGILRSQENARCLISITYDFNEKEKPIIDEFHLTFDVPVDNKPQLDVLRSGSYKIGASVEVFGSGLKIFPGEHKDVLNLRFESVFPLQYTLVENDDLGQYSTAEARAFNLSPVKDFLVSFFSNVSYIGPMRAEPRGEYSIDGAHASVGLRGEFAAQILEKEAANPTTFFKVEDHDKTFAVESVNATLEEAVNYWLCEKFGIAQQIYAKENNGIYRIFLKSYLGLATTINHVGFGVSQILPIIIEGLKMPNNGTLLIEEPESHLHPKLQGQLFDFLYSLTLQGKTIVVETHSDHFINRMRRRVAEDSENELVDKVNLTFIDSDNGETTFKRVGFDQFGVPEYYPKDFIELSNAEVSAIVEAQMNKKLERKANE
jgi:predicted ATPase